MKIYLSIIVISFVFLNSYAQKGADLSETQKQEVLELHNKARVEVGVPELEWSDELATIAKQWAENLAKDGCDMYHSEGSETGENLYWTSHGTGTTPANAVKAWYSEIEYFKNVPLRSAKLHQIGHYTQMVWKSTTHVGMAIANCSKGGTIVVANYSPPGNYLGEKAY